MTRKDYIAIARAIDGTSGTSADGERLLNREQFLISLCNIFASDNPNFDADRFVNACNGGK